MHISFIQVVTLAILQGVSELFPISSLGHTVIIPGLLHWGDLENSKAFLPIIVSLHLGTSIALLLYFWKEWKEVLLAIFNSLKRGDIQKGTNEWVGWLIIIGCIPVGLLGLLLEDPVKKIFTSPIIASTFLIVNGFILLVGEMLKKRNQQTRQLSSLTWYHAILIGLVQSLALIPGISRSGSSMVASLGVGLSHEDAARYSFLLSAPVIGAAAVLEIPQLAGQSSQTLLYICLGTILAGLSAFASTKFLMRYFETGKLYPFAYYCWGFGLVTLLFFLIR